MVGVTGFEPAASKSQTSRATNCATPRNGMIQQRYIVMLLNTDLSLLYVTKFRLSMSKIAAFYPLQSTKKFKISCGMGVIRGMQNSIS